MRSIHIIIALLASSALAACSDDGGGAADAGTDAGTDSDTDVDGDTDGDSDADSGPDADTDTNPFSDECPDYDCTFFVNGSLGDYAGHDGSSWELSFATVEEGLDAAEAMVSAPDAGPDAGPSSECAVWVAAGTYLPTEDASGDPVPENERLRTIVLRPGVALYGGFAGTESSCGERDIVANSTVLWGETGDEDDFPEDNVYHVVTGADDATIDGFTIAEGSAFVFHPEDELYWAVE
jgi:hypothetical protein